MSQILTGIIIAMLILVISVQVIAVYKLMKKFENIAFKESQILLVLINRRVHGTNAITVLDEIEKILVSSDQTEN